MPGYCLWHKVSVCTLHSKTKKKHFDFNRFGCDLTIYI